MFLSGGSSRYTYPSTPTQRTPFTAVYRHPTQHSLLQPKITNTSSVEDLTTHKFLKDPHQISTDTIERPLSHDAAARKIYEALLLNSWRKTKEKNQTLTNTLSLTRSQQNKTHMAVRLLTKLLATEKEKSANAIHHAINFKDVLYDNETLLDLLKEEIQHIEMDFQHHLSEEKILISNTETELLQQLTKKSTLQTTLMEERHKSTDMFNEVQRVHEELEDMEEYQNNNSHFIQALQDSNLGLKEMFSSTEETLLALLNAEKSANHLLQAQIAQLSRTTDHLNELNKDLHNNVCNKEETVSALEKELAQQGKEHELQMENTVNMIFNELAEVRHLHTMKENRTSVFSSMARTTVNVFGRATFAVFSSLAYALFPHSDHI